MYINTKTGERTFQHPCDDYYKQLVLQQRKKKGGSKILGSKKNPPPQVPTQKQQFPSQSQVISQVKPAVVDPLLKMQQ